MLSPDTAKESWCESLAERQVTVNKGFQSRKIFAANVDRHDLTEFIQWEAISARGDEARSGMSVVATSFPAGAGVRDRVKWKSRSSKKAPCPKLFANAAKLCTLCQSPTAVCKPYCEQFASCTGKLGKAVMIATAVFMICKCMRDSR